MEDAAFDELVEDIRVNGLLEDIVTFEGKVLDGRNRERACGITGVQPRYREYEGYDPVGFILSKNLQRRHLSESQRAMVGARLATMRQGQRTDLGQICAKSQADAAMLLNISRRSLQHAHLVLEHGASELADAVDQDKLAVSLAAVIAKEPADYQRRVAKMIDAGTLPREAMHQPQLDHQRQLVMPVGKFRTLVVDPPWPS
jgi:ParB-like chromosome segregation protein Spo0J